MRNAVVLNTINRALSQLRTRLYNNRVVARAATLRGQATSTQTCIFHTRCQVSIFFDYKNDHTLIPRYLSPEKMDAVLNPFTTAKNIPNSFPVFFVPKTVRAAHEGVTKIVAS